MKLNPKNDSHKINVNFNAGLKNLAPQKKLSINYYVTNRWRKVKKEVEAPHEY